MSKGSKRRPAAISQEEFEKRWEAVFKRDSSVTCDHEWVYQEARGLSASRRCVKCNAIFDA